MELVDLFIANGMLQDLFLLLLCECGGTREVLLRRFGPIRYRHAYTTDRSSLVMDLPIPLNVTKRTSSTNSRRSV